MAAFFGVWLIGVPLVWLTTGPVGLATWSAFAAAFCVLTWIGCRLERRLSSISQSPLVRLLSAMTLRAVFALLLLVYAFTQIGTDSLVVDKRFIAFCVTSFYFTALAVEVFSAPAILSTPTKRQLA